MLVVPSGAAGLSLAVGSTRMEDYANITNFNEIDIHVFRYNATNLQDRAGKARAWRTENKEGILKEIRLDFTSTSTTHLYYFYCSGEY